MGRAFIRAKIETADGQYGADFDALNWFRQAPGDEIVALAGGRKKDVVAEYMSRRNREVQAILEYCRSHSIGFEVSVNAVDANDWLRLNRPLVQDQVREATRER
jgi:hypothetical protein